MSFAAEALMQADVAERVLQQTQSLERFTQEMEEQFLALGQALQNIEADARGIEEHCNNVISLYDGSQDESPIQSSFHWLKKAEDLILANLEQYSEIIRVLLSTRSELQSLLAERGGLERALYPLRLIITQFRIEASGFGGGEAQDLCTLADGIYALVERVRLALERQFSELHQVETQLSLVLEELSLATEQHKSDVAKTLERTRAELQSLGNSIHDSAKTVQDWSALSDSIGLSVGQVVMALQCQDMTRQKIEHVVHALQHLQSPPEADSSSPKTPFAKDICEIQSRQLLQVYADLENAADQISQGMKSLEQSSQRLGSGAQLLGQSALDLGIVNTSQGGMKDVLLVLDSTVLQTQNVLQSMRPLQSKLENYTDEVLRLGLEVRLSAFNVQVYGARVEQAAALEVLSQWTRKVASDTMNTVQSISSRLRSLAAAIAGAYHSTEAFNQLSCTEHSQLGLEAKLCQGRLLGLDKDLVGRLAELTGAQQHLSKTTNGALQGLRFPALVQQAKAQTEQFFSELLDSLPAQDLSESTSDNQLLEQLSSRYTMEAERLVHSQVLGQQSSKEATPSEPELSPSPLEEPPGAPAGTELGDNVELF